VYVYVRNREAEAMQHVGLGADHGAFGVTFSRVARAAPDGYTLSLGSNSGGLPMHSSTC
jgi:hypothetical protein